ASVFLAATLAAYASFGARGRSAGSPRSVRVAIGAGSGVSAAGARVAAARDGLVTLSPGFAVDGGARCCHAIHPMTPTTIGSSAKGSPRANREAPRRTDPVTA